MYEATVVKVMIASPSDVGQERQLVRDVLFEWNAVHSEDKGLALMPVGWDTHAGPAMGERPQALINKQVLKSCDLLVAVFWTRIGSPTGVAASGTVEEIEEHVRAGKPAMIYFSQAPVRPDSVDDEQYRALVDFKQNCQARGLIETYDSAQEFREKFARQLAQTVIRSFNAGNDEQEARAFAALQLVRGRDLGVETLSDDARKLLIAGSLDRSGTIMRLRMLGGMRIQANNQQFAEMGDARSEARWDAALELLRERELVQEVGHKGELFRLTAHGFEVADLIKGNGAA